jgi:hypothetical protein
MLKTGDPHRHRAHNRFALPKLLGKGHQSTGARFHCCLQRRHACVGAFLPGDLLTVLFVFVAITAAVFARANLLMICSFMWLRGKIDCQTIQYFIPSP